MRRALLVVLILAVTATAADARRRHHRHSYPDETFGLSPDTMPARPDRALARPDRGLDRHSRATRDARDADARAVPAGWQLQPPDSSWHGKRYLSPDGSAWFATYTSPSEEPVAAHMKTVAFGDGEELTYLRGERDWIAVSGLKADRIFYRKAVLACGGRVWRHVAFEYPADAKRSMDGFVNRAAATVERPTSEACDAPVSSSR
jgi:hypothetical protein